jgi:glucose-6-phosphate 1-dehydrogenase
VSATSIATIPAPEEMERARIPDEHVFVLFGATGDLSRRKLLPGLFHLRCAGLMPERVRIVGTGRGEYSDEEFREFARDAVAEFGRWSLEENDWDGFEELLSYVPLSDDGSELAEAVHEAEREIGGEPWRLHYLAVPPAAFPSIIQTIAANGLADRARVICEKPFGTDLESARELNKLLHSVFTESQIFRIDHFLGKEAVQNILALRFANGMFEPIWNRQHIDHVQIDVPETLGIGTRAGFYEETGAFRDMVVTHLFQVLSFVAMEPPTALAPKPLVVEKTKVFDAMPTLHPENMVRGQYIGYRDEPGVAPDSDTETFVALKCFVENWRWHDVPFFLRTGKRMAESRRSISIVFREPPLHMFRVAEELSAAIKPNQLKFDIGDPGGISMGFLSKVPGPRLELGSAHMDFVYEHSFCTKNALEAYERLIHDAMMGDHTLFTTADGIERLWAISEPVLKHPPPVHPYRQGSWGPAQIDDLIRPRKWLLPD